jgi:hypothetical protein
MGLESIIQRLLDQFIAISHEQNPAGLVGS